MRKVKAHTFFMSPSSWDETENQNSEMENSQTKGCGKATEEHRTHRCVKQNVKWRQVTKVCMDAGNVNPSGPALCKNPVSCSELVCPYYKQVYGFFHTCPQHSALQMQREPTHPLAPHTRSTKPQTNQVQRVGFCSSPFPGPADTTHPAESQLSYLPVSSQI